MKLRACGEDRLVAALTRALPQGKDVRAGPGDDCAVIGAPRARIWQLLKTEVVVEGVHFLPQDEPQRVGWKALCRAVSDIAAMGGLPSHALVTVAVSGDEDDSRLKGLYAGLRKAARRFDISIVGGETARSPGPLFINVALTGWVERALCLRRSGGRAGDLLYVTGRLGGSRAGRHLDFVPRLEEARWLAAHAHPSAMMDLSDGLAADLPRLARASGCGCQLNAEAIPRSPGSTLENAISDGEDFELLAAIAPARAKRLEAAWPRRFPRIPLTRIGSLTSPPLRRIFPAHGFDHFAQP